MTDREFWLRINRQAARLEPDLAREYLRGFERLREHLSRQDLERLMRSRSIDRLLSETLTDEQIREAFAGFRAELQRAIRDATIYSARNVPGAVPELAFNVLSPHVVDAVRDLDTRVMSTLADDVRETFRVQVQQGFEAGVGPRVIARQARARLPLAPNQVAAIENFRRMLEAGDREALTRQLRDKRFDRTLQKALGARGTGLTPDQVDRMVAAYERKMIAFNAETQARTASLDVMKAGQRLAWENAIANGVVDRNRLRKRWANVGDSRVRPEHRDPPEGLNGEVVAFDERFSNGEMVPGESTYNCRCLARYFPAAAELAA